MGSGIWNVWNQYSLISTCILAYRLFVLVKFHYPMAEVLYVCFNFTNENETKCEVEKNFSDLSNMDEIVNICVISFHTLIGTTCCVLTLLQLLKPNEDLGATRTTDTNRKAAHTTLILSLICNVLNVASIGCSAYIAGQEYVQDDKFIKNAVLATFLNMQFVPLNSPSQYH